MCEVDEAGQQDGGHVVSAARFAEVTGVSRERLRTWERRHGFPVPARVGSGPRRYALADAPRVMAVRRAVEAGVPLPAAIAAGVAREAAPGPAAFEAALEELPLPALLATGPEPLRVAFANAALRAAPAAPVVGEELGAAPALAELFAGPVAARELALGLRPLGRVVAYRVPVPPGAPPLVAAVALEAAGEREARRAAAELERQVAALSERAGWLDRWLEGLAGVARAFQVDPTPAALDAGTDTLIRQLRAADGVVATYAAGQLLVPRSRRGLLGPATVTITPHVALAVALRDAEPLWLEPAARRALELPPGLHALAAPVLAAGETLGVLLLLVGQAHELGRDERRLLAAVSSALGFALLRDRLARELREVAGG
jgi:DNA-binding transcriptional MerR regulator